LLLRANIGVDTDIVVCKLAHLSVVLANDLSLLGDTESEAWNDVHNPEDDRGDNKGVAEASARISELVAELDPVSVDPATGNDSSTIKSCDFSLGKEASQDVADDTANSVGGEDIEAIIIAEDKFELGGKVANSPSSDTEGNRGRCIGE
jgi:uncharacterized protein (DUF927 family)